MARIYRPSATTVRSTMTLVERREYAGRVIDLYRDDLDCSPERWRRHYVIIDDGTPVSYCGESAAILSINGIIDLIDEELELADIEAAR